MGDEVGLGLGTLQLAASMLNRLLNALAILMSRVKDKIDSWRRSPLGKFGLASFAFMFVVVSAMPAMFAANFGFAPHFWLDLLNPWNTGITFLEPQYGVWDHLARITYALVLLPLGFAYFVVLAFVVLTFMALFFSWLVVGAFGSFSLRLAIATEWAVEPIPEGRYIFYNAGWNRDPAMLARDRTGLRHSEPYSSPSVIDYVANYIFARVK